jgi:2-(1,2-epoxy-1,2-dihydrophenyl)acetyl-CoA isomerase
VSSPVVLIEQAETPEGRRLDRAARDDLRSRLRSAARGKPGCLVISVEGASWHQAPDFGTTDPTEFRQPEVAASFSALSEQLFQLPIPVVVVVDGPVSGFGLALSLAADVRLASPRATFSFGGPASAAALLGGAGWLTTRAVGAAVFSDLAWTGTVLDAEAAARRGLITGVTPHPGEAARELAEALAAVPAATSSALKRALTSRQRPELAAALDYESWLVGVATTAPATPA